jgi:hypothetical protein
MAGFDPYAEGYLTTSLLTAETYLLMQLLRTEVNTHEVQWCTECTKFN